jgi:hypothetical protein
MPVSSVMPMSPLLPFCNPHQFFINVQLVHLAFYIMISLSNQSSIKKIEPVVIAKVQKPLSKKVNNVKPPRKRLHKYLREIQDTPEWRNK